MECGIWECNVDYCTGHDDDSSDSSSLPVPIPSFDNPESKRVLIFFLTLSLSSSGFRCDPSCDPFRTQLNQPTKVSTWQLFVSHPTYIKYSVAPVYRMKSLVVIFLAVQNFLSTSAFLPVSQRLPNSNSLSTVSAISGIPTTLVTEGSDFLPLTAAVTSLLASNNDHNELLYLVSSHPLTLSLYAGLSTCLGAAVVFLAGHDESSNPNNSNNNDNKAALTDDHLALSLSLAGSVMVTVTVISLLPESFHDESTLLLPNVAVERCLSMAAGCGLYLLLARCTFPDDSSVIFGDNNETVTGVSVLNGSKSQHGLALVPQIQPGDVLPKLQEYHVNDNQIVVEERGYAFKGLSTGEDLVTEEARRSWRIAILLFLSLAVHNFPEGE